MDTADLAQVGTTGAVLLALLSTAVLAVLHLLAPRIRKLPLIPERATASFAGGLAVAYVFLHLLPEVARGNAELRELFGEELTLTPLFELAIFVVALTGFCLFYGLERLAERSSEAHSRGAQGEPGGRRLFWVHLAAFALYNAVITYTLPLSYRTGIAFAVLFTVAMGLHFVLVDRGLEENYGRLFDRRPPRLVLAGALVLGWALAWLFAPTASVTISVLTAFLAGSVLLNVFKEEIPSGRESSFGWFMVGLVSYAVLLGVLIVLGADQSPAEASHPTNFNDRFRTAWAPA